MWKYWVEERACGGIASRFLSARTPFTTMVASDWMDPIVAMKGISAIRFMESC
jgi:hypothetical protein